jgi:hypothetical protein
MSPTYRTRLRLESLEHREVPATLNLTTAGSQGFLNGAHFAQLSPGAVNPADTNTFLRLQEGSFLGSLLTPEEGYNTSARPLQFDAVGNTSVTRSLKLSEVPLVTLSGVQYREFLLTVNQPVIVPNIDLTELRIFRSTNGMLTGYNTNTDRLNGQAAVFDLDSNGNHTVRVNDNLNRTGSPDVRVLIPDSAFNGANPDTTYVYLYSKFTAFVGTTALSGAESWSVANPPPPPTVGSLSGRVYADQDPDGPEGPLEANGVYDAGEGLGGFTVTLSGLDVNQQTLLFDDGFGNLVTEITTVTGSDGSYSFGDLPEGTYFIAITDQPPLFSQEAQLGTTTDSNTSDGSGVGNAFIDIVLAPGETGVNFDFRMAFVE